MKIAFLNTYNTLNTPELEVIQRYAKIFNSQGHQFEILTQQGFFVNDLTKNINDEKFDLVLCTDASVDELQILPDVPIMFVDWCPYGYLGLLRMKEYISSLKHFDMAVTSCYNQEFELLKKHHMQNVVCSDKEHCVFPSLSDKCIIEPNLRKDRKLIYIGINKDKGLSKGRYFDMLSYLDKTDMLELYGPLNCWKEFNSNKGGIPFDGYSVLNKINEAGVCLALNSKFHNSVNFVTNRIFEGCVAGAAIIADDNPYTRENFGDNVFYVDIYKDEVEEAKNILKILEYINSHPEEVLEKIKNCQKIFMEKFSIEKSIENIIYTYNKYLEKKNQCDLKIEVIIIINNIKDLELIKQNLQKQDYNNFSVLVIIKDENIDEILIKQELAEFKPKIFKFKSNVNDVNCFLNVKNHIRGEFFTFLNSQIFWNHNFLTKMVETLSNTSSNFIYSKIFNTKNQVIYNDSAINYNDLFNILNLKDENKIITYFSIFEKSYVLGAFLYNKKILEIIEYDILFFERSLHIYLAIKAFLKYNDKGVFFNRAICSSIFDTKGIIQKYKLYYRCKSLLSTAIYLAFGNYIDQFNIANNGNVENDSATYKLELDYKKTMFLEFIKKVSVIYWIKKNILRKKKYKNKLMKINILKKKLQKKI